MGAHCAAQAGLLHPRFVMNSWKEDGTVTTPWMHPAATPAVRWAMRLRLRLMPLLYTLYVAAAEAGEPVLRPTFFDFDADPESWAFSDEVGAQIQHLSISPGVQSIVTGEESCSDFSLPHGRIEVSTWCKLPISMLCIPRNANNTCHSIHVFCGVLCQVAQPRIMQEPNTSWLSKLVCACGDMLKS